MKEGEEGKVKRYVEDIGVGVVDCKERGRRGERFMGVMNERG